MSTRITRFSVFQTATALGVLYGIMGILFVPFFYFAAAMAPDGRQMPSVFLIGLPIGYGLAGFIMTAIGCALYNTVARWTGGVEVELGEGPRH